MTYPVGSVKYYQKIVEVTQAKLPSKPASQLEFPLLHDAVEVTISREARALYEANVIKKGVQATYED